MKNSSLFHRICGMILLLFITCSLYSQSPLGFNYQAVARDANNDPLVNENLEAHFSIYNGADQMIWKEQHDVTTNDLGLFSTIICGDNDKKTGGSASFLEDIAWGDSRHSLQVEILFDGSLVDLGQSPLAAVPYALHSLKGTSGWKLVSDTVTTMRPVAIGTNLAQTIEPLFEVRNDNNIPVFAVYNDGVMVYVDENKKGVKGGFAVGGYNTNNKGVTNEYLRVTPDSVRIYINDEPAKGVKGGFAVGGYNTASKGSSREFLRVTDDSTRVYVDDEGVKGVKGGFAVGGYNTESKAVPIDFLSLSPENYFIGHESGSAITSGKFNSFIGYQSGKASTTGNHNIFLGKGAGQDNIAGGYNVIVGSEAGLYNNGHYNVFIGYQSGYNNVSGADSRFSKWNTFIGYRSGWGNTTGWHNLAIGYSAGLSNQTATNQFFLGNSSGESLTEGYGNTFVGHLTGMHSENVSNNTFIGYQSGFRCITGTGNTYLGYGAGLTAPGSGNVFLGNRVGYSETGDNKLYIDNNSGSSPLIYGEFDNDIVTVNGKLGVGVAPSTSPLAVAGLPATTGGVYVRWSGNQFYYYSSSRTTKDNITPLIEDFHKILDAEPVSFIDKSTGKPHIGYIAEDFADIGLENLVIYMDGKVSSLSYELISLYNLEIIKEQQSELNKKDAEINELKSRLEKIEAALNIE